jgi:hypothetical protein
MLLRHAMTSIALRFACTVLTTSVLAAGSARADEGAVRAQSDSCGRAEFLQAAKEALLQGERAEALEHLRKAEALLDACARPSEHTPPDQTPKHREPALAFSLETELHRPLS